MAHAVRRMVKYAAVVAFAIVVGLLGVGVIVKVLQASAGIHWMLGFAVAGIVLALVLLALRWIQQETLSPRAFGIYPRTGLVVNLVIVVLVSAVAMAAVSDALYRIGWAGYVAQRPISLSLLLDYYGWHFVDSIPVLRLWQTFDVEAPAKGVGVLSGLLLLGFRVAIIAWALSLFKSKRVDVRYLTKVAKILREDAAGQDGKLNVRVISRRQDYLEAAVNAPARLDPSLYRIDAYLEYARYWNEKAQWANARECVDLARKRLEAELEARDAGSRLREIEALSAQLDKATST